jgi:hypothetical protein
MFQIARSAFPPRRSSPLRWTGIVLVALSAWSFLGWCIWQVSVELF